MLGIPAIWDIYRTKKFPALIKNAVVGTSLTDLLLFIY